MKKILIIGIVAGVVLGFGLAANAQTMTNTNTNTMMDSTRNPSMDNCSVCGMKTTANTKYKTTYKGKEVRFCSAACEKEFKKNPDKYMKKIEDMEKSGSSMQ